MASFLPKRLWEEQKFCDFEAGVVQQRWKVICVPVSTAGTHPADQASTLVLNPNFLDWPGRGQA